MTEIATIREIFFFSPLFLQKTARLPDQTVRIFARLDSEPTHQTHHAMDFHSLQALDQVKVLQQFDGKGPYV